MVWAGSDSNERVGISSWANESTALISGDVAGEDKGDSTEAGAVEGSTDCSDFRSCCKAAATSRGKSKLNALNGGVILRVYLAQVDRVYESD